MSNRQAKKLTRAPGTLGKSPNDVNALATVTGFTGASASGVTPPTPQQQQQQLLDAQKASFDKEKEELATRQKAIQDRYEQERIQLQDQRLLDQTTFQAQLDQQRQMLDTSIEQNRAMQATFEASMLAAAPKAAPLAPPDPAILKAAVLVPKAHPLAFPAAKAGPVAARGPVIAKAAAAGGPHGLFGPPGHLAPCAGGPPMAPDHARGKAAPIGKAPAKAPPAVPGPNQYGVADCALILHHINIHIPPPPGPVDKAAGQEAVRTTKDVVQWRRKLVEICNMTLLEAQGYGTRETAVAELFRQCPFA